MKNPKNLKNYDLIYKNLNTNILDPLSGNSIILGDMLALKLGLTIGSNIKLYSTQTIMTPFGSLPKSTTKFLLISIPPFLTSQSIISITPPCFRISG